jgi:hypothetical protein
MHFQTREHLLDELARADVPSGASTARNVTSNGASTSGAERITGSALVIKHTHAAPLPGESFSTVPPRSPGCALLRTTPFVTR